MKQHAYFPGMSTLIPAATFVDPREEVCVSTCVKELLANPLLQIDSETHHGSVANYTSATIYTPASIGLGHRSQELRDSFNECCRFNQFSPCEVTVSEFYPPAIRDWQLLSAVCNSKQLMYFFEKVNHQLHRITQGGELNNHSSMRDDPDNEYLTMECAELLDAAYTRYAESN